MAEAEEEKEEKEEKKEKKKDKKKDKDKDGEDEAAKSKKGGLLKNKKLLIIIAAVVVIIGGGAAFMVLKGGSDVAEDGSEAQTEQTAEAKSKSKSKSKSEAGVESEAPSNIKLEPFIVNLVDNSGTRYLKLTLNLDLTSSAMVAKIKNHDARIRDSLIVLLSSKSYAEIGTVEGKYQLRDEIVQRINQFIGGKGVKTAYFTEFVIQ